jgi:hypothetical protein
MPNAWDYVGSQVTHRSGACRISDVQLGYPVLVLVFTSWAYKDQFLKNHQFSVEPRDDTFGSRALRFLGTVYDQNNKNVKQVLLNFHLVTYLFHMCRNPTLLGPHSVLDRLTNTLVPCHDDKSADRYYETLRKYQRGLVFTPRVGQPDPKSVSLFGPTSTLVDESMVPTRSHRQRPNPIVNFSFPVIKPL